MNPSSPSLPSTLGSLSRRFWRAGVVVAFGASVLTAQDVSHRQSSLEVTVRDASGAVVPNAQVRIEMIDSEFRWGTALPASVLMAQSPARMAILNRYFNSITFENDMKWGPYEGTSEARWNDIFRALDATKAFGATAPLRLRGHVTVWSQQAPGDVNNSTDVAFIRSRVEGQIEDYHTFFKGKLTNFDFYNEPGNARSLIAKLHPGSGYPNVAQAEIAEIAAWFIRGQATDPDAQLFINEFNIMNDWNGNDTRVHQYKAFIDRIRDAGGPVGGIGVQAHLDRVHTYEVYKRRFEILAAPMPPTANHPNGLPGLPVEVTELDINPNVTTPEIQAQMVDGIVRAAFETPAVQGVTIWGLSDNVVWRGNAVLLDANGELKPSGEAFANLVRGEYWTSIETTTGANGSVEADVFRGRYRVSTSDGFVSRSVEVEVGVDPAAVEVALSAPQPINSYSDWLDQLYFTSVDDLAQSADPDGDGRSNFQEFVLGSNPFVADTEPFFQVVGATSDGVIVRYRLRRSVADSVNVTGQRSNVFHFAVWSPITFGSTKVGESGDFDIYEAVLPTARANANFFYMGFSPSGD